MSDGNDKRGIFELRWADLMNPKTAMLTIFLVVMACFCALLGFQQTNSNSALAQVAILLGIFLLLLANFLRPLAMERRQ